MNKDYPKSGDTIFFSVNFPKETENCYVKQTVWIDGTQVGTRNGYTNNLEWYDVKINNTIVAASKTYYTVKARVDWIETNGTVAGYKTDIAHAEANTHPNEEGFSPMVIKGETFTDKKAAGTEILAVCKTMTNPDPIPLGSYRGFEMELFFDTFSREYKITLKNELRHTTPLGTDIFGNIQRLDNLIASFPEKQTACENQLNNEKVQLENAKAELDKPFVHEEELKTKSARLAELNAMLDLNKKDNEIVDDDREDEEPSEPSRSDRDCR